jgi:hypothetical protein
MSTRFSPEFVMCLASAAGVATSGCAAREEATQPPADLGQTDELSRIRVAVERALVADPPRGYERIPSGLRLLAIGRDSTGTIALNFSGELLIAPTRVIEDSLRQILMAASSALEPLDGRPADFKVLVNGAALESYLP